MTDRILVNAKVHFLSDECCSAGKDMAVARCSSGIKIAIRTSRIKNLKARIVRIVALILCGSGIVINGFAQILFHKKINDALTNSFPYYYSIYPNQNGVMVVGADPFFSTFIQLNNHAETLQVKRFDINAFVSANQSWHIVHPNSQRIDFFNRDSTHIYIASTNNFLMYRAKKYTYDVSLFNAYSSDFLFGVALSNYRIALVGYRVIPAVNTLDAAAVVLVFDSLLNVLWSAQYYVSGYYLVPLTLIEMGNTYILSGNCAIVGQLTSTNKIFAVRIDRSTGNVIGPAEIYDVAGGELTLAGSGGKYLCGNYFDFLGGTPTKGIVITLNPSSVPMFQETRTIDVPGYTYSDIRFVCTATDGNIYLGGKAGPFNSMGGWSDAHYFVSKADSTISFFHWGKIYSDTLFTGEPEDFGCAYFCKETGNTLLTAGEFTNAYGLTYFINADKNNGQSACKNISVQVQSSPLTLSMLTVAVMVSGNICTGADTTVIPPGQTLPHFVGHSSIICQQTAGIENDEPITIIQVYPNPAGNVITFEMTTPAKSNTELTITLFNSTGQIAANYQMQTRLFRIDVSPFNKGLYFYTINDGEKIISKGKLIRP